MVRKVDDDLAGEPELGPSRAEVEWVRELREALSSLRLGGVGPYEVVEEAGRDEQAVTYSARRAGRTFALKRWLAGDVDDPQVARRLHASLVAAASLDHPGIVAPLGLGADESAALVAADWIDGVPITDWARGAGEAPVRAYKSYGVARARRGPRESLALFLAACDAVEYAHARGVLHTDLKPSNVLVELGGCVRVLDFGLPKDLPEDPASEPNAPACRPGGALWFAAPERLRGEPPDERADVYSLGVLLYEMLTGYHPRDGAQVADLVHLVESEDPTRPSSFDFRLGRDLDAVLHAALARDKRRRYPSVHELAADVRLNLAGKSVRAQPPRSWDLHRVLPGRDA